MPITNSTFDSPRAKLARARSNLSELQEQDQQYFEANPFEITTESRADGLVARKLRLNIPLPAGMATAAGDVIANLRAALDHAVCACAIAEGKTNLKNTYFHFASTQLEWEHSLIHKTKSAPDKIRIIMRNLCPWSDGNFLLYCLSRLAAVDKHQLVTPIAVVPDINVTFAPPRPGAFFIRDLQIPGTIWDPDKGEATLTISDPDDEVMVRRVHI